MADITALIDANVFYSIGLADIIVETAASGLYRARWTDQIHGEWLESLLRNQPTLSRALLTKRRKAMDTAVRNALVAGYEPLIPGLTLPDAGDRHVLAAAIAGRCDTIVTFNLHHFPPVALAPHGIIAAHPDTFLVERLDADEGLFLACVKRSRSRLKNPPRSIDDHLIRLSKVGLPMLASRLALHRSLI